jgi:hypothetical protein
VAGRADDFSTGDPWCESASGAGVIHGDVLRVVVGLRRGRRLSRSRLHARHARWPRVVM